MKRKSDTYLKVLKTELPFTLKTVERFKGPIDRDLQAMARNIKERFLIETSPSKRETLARIGINLTNLIMR